MALGIGYGLPFVTQHGTNPYKTQWAAAREGAKGAGASVEDENAGTGSCLVSRGQDVYTDGLPFTPSLLIVPQFYKEGNLYQDVPPFVAEDTTMRFTVSRNTTATRVNSSGLIESVASGVPRIDWLGQSCPALLVEASGTNVLTYSEDFTQAVWEKNNVNIVQGSGSNAVVTANYDTAPNGTMTADRLQLNLNGGTTSGDRSGLFRSITGLVSGALSTSIYIKSNTVNTIIRLQMVGGTDVVKDITATSSWQRFDLIGNNNTGLRIFLIGTATSNSADLSIWGAQLEAGSIATTYIPTTVAAASRAADVISASGALVSGLIGQTEGTIYLDLTVLSKDSSSTRWLQIFGASNNIGLAMNPSNQLRSIVNAQSDVLLTAPLISSGVKVAWAYDGSGVICFVNGTQYTLTNGGNQTMSSLTSISIDGSASPAFGFARIRAAALYTTRLSNAQLAELTRL